MGSKPKLNSAMKAAPKMEEGKTAKTGEEPVLSEAEESKLLQEDVQYCQSAD